MTPSPNQQHLLNTLKNIEIPEKNVIYMIKGSCAVILNSSNPIIELISKRSSDPPNISSGTSMSQLDIYKNRLKTFNDGWRLDFLTPSQMAKAGFYYMGKQDRVKCMFCSHEFDYWCRGDDPVAEHKRKAPQCQFFNENKGYDVCGLYESPITDSNDDEDTKEIEHYLYSVGAVQQIKAPRYKEYASFETRLLTFNRCQLHLKHDIHLYSKAGLFYAGNGLDDEMLCFYCGQGLRDWEDDDDPWIEHGRWSPTCSYVLLSKGKQFVDETCIMRDEVSKNNQEKLSKLVNLSSAAANHEDHENASMFEDKTIIDSTISKINHLEINGKNKMKTSSEVNLHLSQQSLNTISDSLLCKICFKEEIKVTFMPCCHTIACIQCAMTLDDCAICRQPFSMALRVHVYRDELKDQDLDQSPCSSTQCSLSKSTSDQMICKVCQAAEMEAVFMPCGHIYACLKCATKMHNCPVCSETFCATMQVYL